MHYLHKILVYIPDAVSDRSGCDREALLRKIRTYAEEATECFYEDVYDWRETESAGRWGREYPINVLLAEDDPQLFEKELASVMENQKAETLGYLAQLKNTVGTDLDRITGVIQNCTGCTDNTDGTTLAYFLYCLAAHLYGEYRCDSGFYNTRKYTARLYPADIEAAGAKPEDWALVIFDYHA